MNPKFSLYFYLFNAEKYFPDFKETIDNFLSFADEVVCSTIPSEDNTLEHLKAISSKNPNFKVIESDISLKDNRFDGKLKTVALEATTNPIKIIADADERFPLSTKSTWQSYANLLVQQRFDGFLIPVIDVYGEISKVRRNHRIGQKFRMHKDTIKSRGVIPQAELGNGLFRTDQSDSTEPLNSYGQLGSFPSIVDDFELLPENTYTLKKYPYVVHYGYLDLEKRVKINGEFWDEKWSDRSGKKENVVTDIEVLKREPLIPHNLPLI
jgi:hypothetical protein